MQSAFLEIAHVLGVPAIVGAVLIVLWGAAKTPFGKRTWEPIAGWLAFRLRWRFWALRRYQADILRRDRFVPLPFRRDDEEELEFADIYVEPCVGDDHIPVAERLALGAEAAHRYVVLGEPGAGKSLLLQALPYRWASDQKPRAARIPVRVVAEDLVRHAAEPETALRREIVRFVEERSVPRPERLVDHALSHGRLTILIDALDEVPQGSRQAVEAAILKGARQYPDCHVVVTCRAAAYAGELAGFVELRLHGFHHHQAEAFLREWAKRRGADAAKVGALRRALEQSPRLRELSENPLLLTYMAYLYGRAESTDALPYGRSEFYEAVVNHLLADRKDGHDFSADLKLSALKRIAFESFASQERRHLSYDYVIGVVRDQAAGLSTRECDELLSAIVRRTGLLRKVAADEYAFAHLTVQEYLVALVFKSDHETLVDNFADDPRAWREVLRLWFGGTRSDPTECWRQVGSINRGFSFECLAEVRADSPMFAGRCPSWLRGEIQAVLDDPFELTSNRGGLEALTAHPVVGEVVYDLVAACLLGEFEDRGADVRITVLCDLLGGSHRSEDLCALAAAARLHPAARRFLENAGERMVPRFESALSKTVRHSDAIDIVDTIVLTPHRARLDALVRLLGEDPKGTGGTRSEAAKPRAAWHLAALVLDPANEAHLKACEFRAPEPRPNAWAAFAEPESRGFTDLMNEVVEVASRHLNDAPDDLPRVDPRVAALVHIGSLFGILANAREDSADAMDEKGAPTSGAVDRPEQEDDRGGGANPASMRSMSDELARTVAILVARHHKRRSVSRVWEALAVQPRTHPDAASDLGDRSLRGNVRAQAFAELERLRAEHYGADG